MSNIKDLVDMCKTTVETVGDITVCKELPESTLEDVHLMLQGENKEAFDRLRLMCEEDVGVYPLSDIREIMKLLKKRGGGIYEQIQIFYTLL